MTQVTPGKITVAALQTSYGDDMGVNIAKTEKLVREAAAKGAQVILPSELFQGRYFCTSQEERWFATAYPAAEHPCTLAMQKLAAELGVVIPTSIFERDGPCYYNSLVMVDADGSIMGTYRKSHIPDGPGYQEKYYFRPGDTGFKVWPTRFGAIGVGICWDQWFPECARAMALMGAEVLLYPTAIGSEPPAPDYDSQPHWEMCMRGHAGSNLMPVVASNRIGHEAAPGGRDLTFYGSSFIAGPTGQISAKASRDEAAVITASFDLDAVADLRASWGLFRDRRPETYRTLATLDGQI